MITKTKARKILHDKEIKGQPLTEKQRKFFGARASGYPVIYAMGGGLQKIYTSGTSDQLWHGWDKNRC